MFNLYYNNDSLKQTQKAFSLVELVVTIAILGILATLTIKNYEEYKKKLNDLIALNQLTIARQAVELSILDNKKLVRMDYRFYPDGTTNHYLSGEHDRNNTSKSAFPALPSYIHQEGVSLGVYTCITNDFSDLDPDSYIIKAVHENGAYSPPPIDDSPGGRAPRPGQDKRVVHIFNSSTGKIDSIFGSTNNAIGCAVPITPVGGFPGGGW